ncbi:MAG: RHS repeat-associated core domain-containing protein [Acidobacteriota bacterium]|nr:RHS repeat-associated core domain-containing protein [Acidobacteriota bacterium]
MTGTVEDDIDYYPYGGQQVYHSGSGNLYQFTGDETDSESTTYHTQYRQLSPSLGRWLRPDPYDGSYDPTNPQTLNRYSYVLNSPLGLIDPSGMDPSNDQGTWDCQEYSYCSGPPCPPGSYPDTTGSGACYASNGNGGIVDPNGTTVDVGTGGGFGDIIIFNYGPGGSVGGGGGSSGGSSSAPNNGPRPGCVSGALLSNAVSVGIDAVGLIPEAGGVARFIGNQAGYRGVVADQLGAKVIGAFGKSTSTVNGLASITDTSALGLTSTALTIAGFIPGLGQISSGLSLGVDLYKTYKAVSACYSHP